jgi:catalase
MSAEQKQALLENTSRAMGDAPLEVRLHHVGNCLEADPAHGEGVAEAMGIAINEV